jgi:release factor glutamine methyltransferase
MAETAFSLLQHARRLFADADIDTPQLDARVLLLHAMGLTHEELIAAPETVPSTDQSALFANFVERRLRREPVSKIIGSREFYGRAFRVSHEVLDPRPDTECVIDLALRFLPDKQVIRFADLGTGSGAIAITLLLGRPLAQGVAVDVSSAARAMTKHNSDMLGVASRLSIIGGPWFDQCTDQFDLIISNPPYIPTGDIAGLEDDVLKYDPVLALDGGDDGLNCYVAIADKAAGFLQPGGVIVVEIGAGQMTGVKAVFERAHFVLLDHVVDLGGHVRGLAFRVA